MLAIVGIVLVFAMVFGGYLLAGGKLGIIVKALPFELMMIGGAAAGAFLIGNGGDVVKGSLGDMKRSSPASTGRRRTTATSSR
jgi:chemotaxis protein MotA